MPQPTAPASGLQLLTDFSEVQTKDGGSCGDSPPQATLHRPLQCKDPVMWLLRDGPLSHGFSEKDPPRGFSEKDPSRGFSKKPSWWTERSFPRMFGV